MSFEYYEDEDYDYNYDDPDEYYDYYYDNYDSDDYYDYQIITNTIIPTMMNTLITILTTMI